MEDQHLNTLDAPIIRRVRHELRRRDLTVAAAERLTPHMIRVTLTGPNLDGFVTAATDDHVKVFFPGAGEPERRDYTPRRHDGAKGTLTLDFVDHEGGPAADWARSAQPGDRLTIGGPRGSRVIEGDFDDWLFIGDETALPAIGRFVEELPAGARASLIISVPAAGDAQTLDSPAEVAARWIGRDGADPADPAPILTALAGVELPRRCFVWIAAEARVARAVRAELVDNRGVSPRWLKASGYWVKGAADASVKDLEDLA